MEKYEQPFRDLIPKLTTEESSNLEKSMLKEGCRDAIMLWQREGAEVIIDGHNRYAICQKHGIVYDTAHIQFADDSEARQWIYLNQLSRRNLTPDQMRLIRGWLYENEKQAHGGQVPGSRIAQNEPTSTAESIAKKSGVSQATVKRDAEFFRKAEETGNFGKIMAGEITSKEIKKEERKQDIEKQKQEIETGSAKAPEGLYNVVNIDPPWPYGTEYDPAGRRAANPYPEMSLEEIKAIKIPATEDAVMFLWTTHKFMRHSFDILDTWGFRDVAIITWVKDRMGLGTWLRSQSEFCIMAVKGKPKINLTNQTTVINGKLREHSRKPDEFYLMAEGLTMGRRLDFFSREKRDGWDSFGNDTERFAQ